MESTDSLTIPRIFSEEERIAIGQAFDAAQLDWLSRSVPQGMTAGQYQTHGYEISFAASDRRRALRIIAEMFGYRDPKSIDPWCGACPGCDAMLDRAWQCPSCELNFGQAEEDLLGRFLRENRAFD